MQIQDEEEDDLCAALRPRHQVHRTFRERCRVRIINTRAAMQHAGGGSQTATSNAGSLNMAERVGAPADLVRKSRPARCTPTRGERVGSGVYRVHMLAIPRKHVALAARSRILLLVLDRPGVLLMRLPPFRRCAPASRICICVLLGC